MRFSEWIAMMAPQTLAPRSHGSNKWLGIGLIDKVRLQRASISLRIAAACKRTGLAASSRAIEVDGLHVTFTYDLFEIQLLGLPSHVCDLSFANLHVNTADFHKVPAVVVWPPQLHQLPT